MTTAAARKLESTGWVTVLVGDRSAIEEPLGALGYPLTEFPMAWLD